MKHYIIYSVALTTLSMPVMAQETYESANIATQDLNGTARYVGMGGAMEALGADISTIATNPAGIGLMRKSSLTMSMGATAVKGNSSNASDMLDMKNSKTPMSFDQLGYVYAHETSNGNFVNFGINYHKSRNFNQILSAEGAIKRASQNKVLFEKTAGYTHKYNSNNCSQNDFLYYESFSTEEGDQNVYYNDADYFYFSQNTKGYIGNYNINLSGNCNDKFYWGITFGIHDVNYSHRQVYSEDLIEYPGNGTESIPAGNVTMVDEREIKGQGYDIKAGVIVRPIDDSPLRIGLYVSTPTWYELNSSNYTEFYNMGYKTMEDGSVIPLGKINYLDDQTIAYNSDSYDYKIFTPWKFGASLGYTIGKNIALGASYEYSDYSSLDNRNITEYVFSDYYDTETSKSKSDDIMNRHTENTLRGVSTLKLGAEYKPIPELAIRAGYNHVSPMYQSNGMRTSMLNADGCYFSSTTDYTNWKATNRYTFGVGFNIDDFNIDVAYQRTEQKGDFSPFQSISRMCNGDTNIAPSVEVNNTRNQFLITLGYRF